MSAEQSHRASHIDPDGIFCDFLMRMFERKSIGTKQALFAHVIWAQSCDTFVTH